MANSRQKRGFELDLQADDSALLVAWCAGDRRAGDELWGRYHGQVQRFFRRRVDAQVSADLVQDTFVACCEGRARVRCGEKFRAYVMATAHHVLCHHLRRCYRRGGDLELDVQVLCDEAPTPCTVLEDIESWALLSEGFSELSSRYRTTLELYYFQQQGVREVAACLGTPTATVRTRLQRARAALEATTAAAARGRRRERSWERTRRTALAGLCSGEMTC
ncbi:MAG: sigma-70 family RNA polymerase sigma factor [Myxococcales bacterium]|nr:sigma-70 family RNA polymerase sigma factor [Myxococcales bacterium]